MKLDASLMADPRRAGRTREIAAAAEQRGFAGLWSPEINHDPFLPLALAVDATSRITLGTAVAIAFPRSPLVLAHTAWDLQAASGGRFVLGLGTQVRPHIERRFGVPWQPPVPRLRDYIGALRAIWHAWQTGSRLAYQGEYYQHTLMTPFFSPGPSRHPSIPIFIAGVNAGLAQLAGECADGFHVHPLHSPATLRDLTRPAIAQGAARAGRDPAAITVATSAFVITGDAARRAGMRAMVRQQLAFYASTPSYRVVLEHHGWAEVAEQLSALASARRWGEMPALIDDAMLATFAVEAAPDELGAALVERYTGLVDRLSLYLPFEPGVDDPLWNALLAAFAGSTT